MIWNLLAAAASGSDTEGKGCEITSILPLLLILVAFVVLFFFNRRSQQKQQEEINKTLDAIQPGNKVKTIGGICGVVVEVCPEDNTFILETGSETTGKAYLKFDKKAVYQTDAAPAKEEAAAPAEQSKEEAPFEEVSEEKEVPAEDATEEGKEEVPEVEETPANEEGKEE